VGFEKVGSLLNVSHGGLYRAGFRSFARAGRPKKYAIDAAAGVSHAESPRAAAHGSTLSVEDLERFFSDTEKGHQVFQALCRATEEVIKARLACLAAEQGLRTRCATSRGSAARKPTWKSSWMGRNESFWMWRIARRVLNEMRIPCGIIERSIEWSGMRLPHPPGQRWRSTCRRRWVPSIGDRQRIFAILPRMG
jgi:hypothetical protein